MWGEVMPKKKFKMDWSIIAWIIGVILIVWAIYHMNININIPLQNQTLSVTPNNQAVLSSCSQVCSQNGFSKYYNFINVCQPGESKITYGYPNQAPILQCCCYNEVVSQSTCIDSDGDDKDTPGHVTFGDVYTDKCLDVGQAVTEYICLNGAVSSKNYACDLGETCIQSRSGGYCKASTPVWHPGDVVFQGSGSGTISGADIGFAELDLSDYGISAGGTCRLGAQIQTDWNYVNPECTGLQGMEALKWEFYDSLGLEYTRIDPAPMSLNVDINPSNGHILEWDSINHWRGIVRKTLNLPNCIINDNWSIKIYIYDC
jgi:hypothetical protein